MNASPRENPHATLARTDKASRISSRVIRDARGDLMLMESCATVIASATEPGDRFCAALWSELGEDNPKSMLTRAQVAQRIEEFVMLARSIGK